MSFLEKCPRFQLCCCCCPLRTGLIVFGVLGVLLSAVGLITNFTQDAESQEGKNVAPELNLPLSIINAIFSILLLLALVSKNATYLKSWLYIGLVTFSIGLFCTLIVIVIHSAWLKLIPVIIASAIAVYYWLCVNSYYLEIKGGVESIA